LVFSWGANLLNSSDLLKHKDFLSTSASSERLSARVAQESPEFEQDFQGLNEYLQDDEGRIWSYLNFNIDWQAVCHIAVPIITKFTFRTNGTCLSPRIPGVGWSYFGADPDWGEKQARQLRLDLEAALANFDVKVATQIQGSIEIVPTMLDKGAMVTEFFKKLLSLRASAMPPFVMIMGDEESDDKMYDALYRLIGSSSPATGIANLKAFTVNVGKRPSTTASTYVGDVTAAEELLTDIAKRTVHEQRLSQQQKDPRGPGTAGTMDEPRPMEQTIEHVED
jgi:trehalose-6-phosphatase